MIEKQAFEILKKASTITDARIVLRNILGDKKTHHNNDQPLTFRQWRHVKRAAAQLRRGMPVAKIIGKKWFFGIEFETNCNTLDPRPDSETLVEGVLKSSTVISRRQGYGRQEGQRSKIRILDMGTGTGCLIGAIAVAVPDATGIGIDKYRGARAVARRNMERIGVGDRIKIRRGTFARPCATRDKFDFIIANPPYIATDDSRVNAGARHDPASALYAGTDGLDAYRKIAVSARTLLNPGGVAFLEIGVGMGGDVRHIFERAGWQFVRSFDDLAGLERVLMFGE